MNFNIVKFLNRFKLSKQYHLKDYKIFLVFTVTLLSILGIMVIGSAKPEVQDKQILGLVVGLVAMLVVSLIDYLWVMNYYWVIYGMNLFLLFLVQTPLGETVNNARRWINLRFTNVQPSELSKILTIIFFAKYLKDHEDDLNTPRTIITSIFLLIPTLALIFIQPDLSTTICICMIFAAVMFLAGLSYKFIGTVVGISVPLIIIFLFLAVQPDPVILKPYQQTRILAWLYPDEYASEEAWQQNNAKMAIGSGQLTGKGLNNNTITSVKNGNYISEPQTDFIFAIVGEELGFAGCVVVIGLLLLIVIQCLIIGMNARDPGGRILCCGIGSLIGFQSFINISVATGLFPNTGIPLPFVSYGLTSLVSLYLGIGLVLNVGLQPEHYQ